MLLKLTTRGTWALVLATIALALALAMAMPQEAQAESDYASMYGPGLWGNETASGETLQYGDWSAASPWLPFGTEVTVCYWETGVCVHNVRITDRGPYIWGRTIDLEWSVGEALGLPGVGPVDVYVEAPYYWDWYSITYH
jgi:peptidoglycan lytic transglycosylase